MVVDDDAVVELEAAALEEPGLGLDADADDGEEGLDLLARGGHGRRSASGRSPGTPGSARRAAARRRARGRAPRPDPRAPPRRAPAMRWSPCSTSVTSSPRMRSEAATSEPMKLPPTTSDLARLGRLLRRRATASASVRKVWTAGRSPPGTESMRGCAPLAITSVPYGIDSPPASLTVCASGSTDSTGRVEAKLDDEVVVLLGLVDERAVRLHLPAQDALRERRPVVGRRLVGGDDRDQRIAAGLTVGVDEAGGRAAAADDHDRILRLRHQVSAYPAVARRSHLPLLVPGHRVRHVRLLERARPRRPSARAPRPRARPRHGRAFVAPTIGAVTPGLRDQPGERDLRARHAALGRDLADAVDDGEVDAPGRRASRRTGRCRRASSASRRRGVRLPARSPRASGLHGSTPTPWSMHCGIISRSSSR